MSAQNTRHVYDFPRLVPLAAILEHYHLLSGLKKIGGQLFGTCPIHQGSNKKQFVVDLEKHVWRCFGNCNRGGGTLELVAELEKVEIKEAARLVRDWFALAPLSEAQQRRKPQRSKAMSGGKPSHKAFVVEDKEEGSDEKPFWTRVGSAWPHGDGKGLNIQIASGVSVSGRLVLREYTEKDAEEDEKKSAKYSKKK
jgi:CHC2 zinc finger